LTEIVNALFRAKDAGQTKIIYKDGFKELSLDELYDYLDESYSSFGKSVYDGRLKGYEIYYTEQLAELVAYFYGYLDIIVGRAFFSEDERIKFNSNSEGLMSQLESIIGIPRYE